MSECGFGYPGANPYWDSFDNQYYWVDNHREHHGPFETYNGALLSLLTYLAPKPKPWWKRIFG